MIFFMITYHKHLIKKSETIKAALKQLNELAADAILFVVDENHRLIGSMTDGDVRRGFLRGLTFDSKVEEFIQPNPKFLIKCKYSIEQVIDYRNQNFRIIPVVDDQRRIVNIVNFRFLKSYLPIDAVVMAGGRGVRLKPLTDVTPKSLLPVGTKSIIDHNVDRLISYGVDDFWMTLRYLGDQIERHFEKASAKNVSIRYVWEDAPLGTIGAVGNINDQEFNHETILLTNSDVLTNLDYEDFYLDFIKSGASLSVATVPYSVKIPYAVLETSNSHVLSFKEKPTYTYYSNAGIYLIKRDVLKLIPDGFFNATDFMEMLLNKGHVVNSYPVRGYWLDIGNPEDYAKAQTDINHINF